LTCFGGFNFPVDVKETKSVVKAGLNILFGGGGGAYMSRY
jgi:hypothetical protein